MAVSGSITETVFPAVGKGMPDVISYLDEVPWSTAADVKPMLISTMVDTYPSQWASTGVSFRGKNPNPPSLLYAEFGIEGALDVGINATDLTIKSSDLVDDGMRPIVWLNGPIAPLAPPAFSQIAQEMSTSLGPFMMIDDEIIRYQNPRYTLPDGYSTPYYPYIDVATGSYVDDFIVPSISERGMFGTTPTSHLAGATIKELMLGYITGIEYNSNSDMVTMRTTIVGEFWGVGEGEYFDTSVSQWFPFYYRGNYSSTSTVTAFSVPRKQISAMGLGQ
tara:strand:+ start:151 stop:981 length:831 start_codon:yes stop_codon:yes gene_type:complete